MATISKVFKSGNMVGWQVKIRRKGVPTFTLSFCTYDEAADWSNENEWEYIRNPKKYLNMDRLDARRGRERKRRAIKV